jgi:hypothetical protein
LTRQSRTLLLLAVVAVLGLTALAMMAQRYGRIASQRVPPAGPAIEAPKALPQPMPAPDLQPPVEERATSDGLAQRQVQAFLSVREAIQGIMDKHPAAMRSMLAELEGRTGTGKVKMHPEAILGLRTAKEKALASAGISREVYDRVREAYRARIEGRPAPDPALDAALSQRAVEAASLGSYERLDF